MLAWTCSIWLTVSLSCSFKDTYSSEMASSFFWASSSWACAELRAFVVSRDASAAMARRGLETRPAVTAVMPSMALSAARRVMRPLRSMDALPEGRWGVRDMVAPIEMRLCVPLA